jgi:cytochrome c biogenesis protein CcmG/thiol:disulfide interchange protein DsbE
MRRALILLGLFLLTAHSSAEPGPSTGVDLSPWKGQVVLLDFWASWCGPCRESFPWMDEMARKYADRGLVVVAINVDRERQAADGFLEGTSFDFQYLYDPEGLLAEAHAVETMPSSILFDRQGRPVFRHAGFRRKERREYEKNIVAVLDGRLGVEDAAAAMTARAGIGARPWERDLLALPDMNLNTDPLDLAFDDHMYFSKEASSGGRGFGGGGCGCN